MPKPSNLGLFPAGTTISLDSGQGQRQECVPIRTIPVFRRAGWYRRSRVQKEQDASLAVAKEVLAEEAVLRSGSAKIVVKVALLKKL